MDKSLGSASSRIDASAGDQSAKGSDEAVGPDEMVLDYSGLICPLPVLRARKALMGLAAGTLVTVLTTDRAAPRDFAAWCAETGHVLVLTMATEQGHLLRIRRGSG